MPCRYVCNECAGYTIQFRKAFKRAAVEDLVGLAVNVEMSHKGWEVMISVSILTVVFTFSSG